MNWICLALVIISYTIGHLSGYKMCRLKIKNILKKKIFSFHHTYPNRTDVLDGMQQLLREVTEL